MIPKETLPEPKTIGEHVRAVRLARGLTQKQAAAAIGVKDVTVLHWEKGQMKPRIKEYPGILRFLGYDPFPAPTTLGERMLTYRQRHGLNAKQAAARCGLHWETWASWETGKNKKWGSRVRGLIEAVIERT